jgi:hypothetical protein
LTRRQLVAVALVVALATPAWAHEETVTFRRGECRVEVLHGEAGTAASFSGCDPKAQTCPEPDPCPEPAECICEEPEPVQVELQPTPAGGRGLLQPLALVVLGPGDPHRLPPPPAPGWPTWAKVTAGVVLTGLAVYAVNRTIRHYDHDHDEGGDTTTVVIVGGDCRGRCD